MANEYLSVIQWKMDRFKCDECDHLQEADFAKDRKPSVEDVLAFLNENLTIKRQLLAELAKETA